MMMKFTREQLYKEIWETSARQVAIKYSLNYQKLLNQCKEISIPLPGGKYFYNRQHGLDIDNLITPLPDSKVSDIEVEKQRIRIQKKETVVEFEKDIRINTEKTLETDSNQNKTVNKVKILFDRDTLYSSLNFLEREKKDSIIKILSEFEISERKRLHKKVVAYKESIVVWHKRVKASERDYYDPRYRRNDLSQPKFIKDVSEEQLPRLYRILDTLITIFEKIGERITNDLRIQIGKDTVDFEVIESTVKVNHELTKEEARQLVEYNDEVKRRSYASKPNIRKYDYIPNGLLRIKVSNGEYIKDTKLNKLEDMIPEIVILFYQRYFEIRTQREDWEETQRKREEEKQKARMLQERIDQEKKKTREFLNMLSDYKLADEIRKFVGILKDSDKADQETIEWMSRKADWIDPTISAEDELLGKREHYKSDEEKNKFLKEEKYYW
ncbi:cellulose synthase [Streptococcus parasuis]|uniref:cellulose synthase n=1 Tax=Streptococcus parasuis TaxID=1501662 RepID=UPI00289BE4FE|nr:cellulose synthase [Streptococcus parasuis]